MKKLNENLEKSLSGMSVYRSRSYKLFKAKRNISWYRDTRVMVAQIKHFAKFPPSFSNLWLKNNLKVVRDTYEKAVFDSKQYLR